MLVDLLGFFLLVIVLLLVFIILGIKDEVEAKKYEDLTRLRDFRGEVTRITKKQAKELLGNDNVYKKLLKRKSYYFLFVNESQNWLTHTTGIKSKTILITEKYAAGSTDNINNLSRVLVYESEGKLNVRQTWCIGKVSSYNFMLKTIFDRERFKALLDKYEDYGEMLDPYSIKTLLDNKMTFYNNVKKDNGSEPQIMIVTERVRYGQAKKDMTTLSVVTAKDCYQVISSVAIKEKKD